MAGEKQYNLFLSYNKTDEAWVKRLKDSLAARGFTVWLACDDIAGGNRFPVAIDAALSACEAFAVVVTPESMASNWVIDEYSAALDLSNRRQPPFPVIPLLLRTAEMPELLRIRQIMDFQDAAKFDETFEKFVTALESRPSAEPPLPQRVCFISSEYPPRVFGGLGIHVQKLTTALAAHLDVDVMLPDPGDNPYLQLSDRVRPVTVQVPASYDDPASWFRFAEYAAAKLCDLPEEERPALIHCHDWVTVLAGIKCRWLLNVPLVFHVHLPNRSPLCASIENLGLVCADLVTVNSEAMYQEINDRRFSVRKLQIVKNGVDLEVFRPAADWPADGGYILFVGRLVEQKGVEYLLRAFTYVREKFPDVRLKIVGDGEFREWLDRLTNNLVLTAHVDFLDWVQHEELALLYQQARMVVVPSVFEPFGMVALEAMAAKRPVVASKTGGLREIVIASKTGYLAEPKDHLDLAQWMMTLLADRDLSNRMGETGYLRVTKEGYTWPAIADRVLELYRELEPVPANKDKPKEADGFIWQINGLAPAKDRWDWYWFLNKLFDRKARP